jgi:methylenetetrahydrofolate reductase (NADPH)
MRDRAAAQGISAPIIPGMMPTTNFKGIQRMAQRCGARVPEWMARVYDGLDSDVESRRTIAAAVMAEQVTELHRLGFDQFHFYTLNQSDLTYAACRLLGLQAKEVS